MRTILTYMPDITDFMAEIEAKYPEYLIYAGVNAENGEIEIFNIDKINNYINIVKKINIIHTPLKKNGTASLGYSIVNTELLAIIEDLITVENIGDYDEMFANEVAHEKYKSVYPYHMPQTYVDENGIEQTRNLPDKIGVFA